MARMFGLKKLMSCVMKMLEKQERLCSICGEPAFWQVCHPLNAVESAMDCPVKTTLPFHTQQSQKCGSLQHLQMTSSSKEPANVDCELRNHHCLPCLHAELSHVRSGSRPQGACSVCDVLAFVFHPNCMYLCNKSGLHHVINNTWTCHIYAWQNCDEILKNL